MALTRGLCVACTCAAMLALASAPLATAADKLPISVARERAAAFAENTCSHDKHCASSGVKACRRQSDRVVICRIFDHRKTEEQGSFVCTRPIRLALNPRTNRVPVTGVGEWAC
ncbi:MAG TPA: hypothetical protein VIS51_06410 [Solirubrobacterales bacterium]